jgi:hypothetical protein
MNLLPYFALTRFEAAAAGNPLQIQHDGQDTSVIQK